MFEQILSQFRDIAPNVDYWSIRLLDETQESVSVRQGVVQPLFTGGRRGALITILEGSGLGYAATSHLGTAGLSAAIDQARAWARATTNINLLVPRHVANAEQQSRVSQSQVAQPWHSWSLVEKIERLQDVSQRLKSAPEIVDWRASLTYCHSGSRLLSSAGGDVTQSSHILFPHMQAVANQGSDTQSRSYGGERGCQGGLEQLERLEFFSAAERVAEEALALLHAPNCPSECMDLLLLPEQMMMQIHESIGHPLELDRILGDERNYAGTSFVELDMFGHYQYGSPLLNVTFDPSHAAQLASYAYDDEGIPAEKVFVIEDGILQRPLGSATSQNRASCAGVANARSCDWNRPPIDRMANLNVEPGESTYADLVTSVEHGILMDTNRSWSIDDSRNKFQFGCEYGRLIENGELKGLVKNPNYRGISATFWRNLTAVGDAATFEIMGTPYCGKGEPNQAICVGHASPACLFTDVDVFGGA